VYLSLGGESGKTLTKVTTDQAGGYQLTYPFTSTCQTSEQTGYLIDVSAEGYDTKSTLSFDTPFSDPPIYCTNDPQVINLSLQPLGGLQLITNTNGSGLDPDGYLPVLTGTFYSAFPSEMSIGYPMGVNAEQTLPLLPGQFTLELTEVTGNCTVAGDNPRTITVIPRDTVASTFDVTCAP